MLRSAVILAAITVCIAVPAGAQDNAAALQAYFSGKQVTLKIDMPGTQKGVDLRFNKPTPMDWKEYGSRIKQFGVAIHQGDVARITTIVVKRDMIEFQLDGGGFGTAGDDTNTTVTAKPVEKSAYEKDLENQIANTDDPDKKASLQRDLDRERARRERLDAYNQHQAQYASQQKAAVVAQNRATGGSRFNLRWSDAIPTDQLTPEGVMQRLSEYVSFTSAPPTTAAAPASNAAAATADSSAADTPATAKLKRGMSIQDVTALFGPGKQLSESVGDAGLKTQIFEYTTSDRRVNVTYVDGVVVRYSINSL
ncbi:MAG: hypothetical protein WAK48_13675 [Candidatus Acidiferrum sp.]|jgi:hypothetical protein